MFIAAAIVISAMLMLQSVGFLAKSARLAELRLVLVELEQRMLIMTNQARPRKTKQGCHG